MPRDAAACALCLLPATVDHPVWTDVLHAGLPPRNLAWLFFASLLRSAGQANDLRAFGRKITNPCEPPPASGPAGPAARTRPTAPEGCRASGRRGSCPHGTGACAPRQQAGRIPPIAEAD